MLYGSSYILILIGALISGIAALNVKSTFKKFSKVGNMAGYTGKTAAEKILHDAGIYDVPVQRTRGNLTDYYSPSERVLKLSESVYDSQSVAAIGVAAHECGHAIQDQQEYMPLRLRSVSVPVANIGSKLSWPLLILGVVLSSMQLAQAGVYLFVLVVLFQLITLPVEFNASQRALAVLENKGMLSGTELGGAKKVLKAAALTYVAALFTSILQLLRMVLIAQGGNRRRR